MSPRHTPLFACAHVPDFFVQAAFRHYRGLAKERPAAVLDGPDSLMKVLACNGHARKAGVRTGMTKIQAEACLGITLRKRSAEDEDLVQQALIDCGFKFAFRVESTCPGTIIMDLSGTQRLLGQPQEIANNIVDECGSSFDVAIGMAANPDTAFYAACGFAGVTVISPGEEASRLGPLPVSVLQADSEILETLESWGVRHFKALASLPPIPLSARLGQLGLHLQQLALGKVKRELVPAEPLPVFREGIELEEAVELLEPLGFLLNRLLEQLCQRLITHSLATNQVLVDLVLEDHHDQQLHPDSSPPSRSPLHQTRLKLPVPTQDAKILLKLLQLDLAAHPPQAAVKEVTIEACPARVRTTQTGLFQPLAPEPTNLEITLARLRAVVGERDQQGCERVGFPVVTDTHRPDTFQVMQSFSPARERGYKMRGERVANTLTLRVFRPPLPAKVKLRDAAPSTISFLGTRAQVKDASGPWRGRGEWWSRVGEWNREEWDIGLMSDGHPAIYRIFQDCGSGQWFVEGLYD
ncbi:MAG: Y-family DNA polymerase [Candidatus Angelobacter sp.]